MLENAWPQAAFDPRTLSLPLIGDIVQQPKGTVFPLVLSSLRRGYIKQDQTQYTGKNAPIYACAFLYNPSTITVTHGLDANSTSAVLPQYYRNPADTGVYYVGLASTLSFSLLFDRTYELNTGIPQGPDVPDPYPDNIPTASGGFTQEDPRRLGVEVDIRALRRICGILGQTVSQSWTDDKGQSQTKNLTGPMMQIPSWVHFGGEANTNSLSYFGYISGLSIDYTHFSTNMVPMRAAVAVSFTLLPTTS